MLYSATMRDVLGVVLGGGEGKRLFPLTKDRSKPAVPLGGKYRLVDIPVSNCINSGLRRIFVLTQYNSASLNRHIAQSFKFDYLSPGFVEVLAAEIRQGNYEWYRGTADAIRQNLLHFRNHRFRHYLILAGDHLYRMDFRRVIGQHVRTNSQITVGAVLVSRDDVTSLGAPLIDEKKRIVKFYEKPKDPELVRSLRLSDDLISQNKLQTTSSKCYLASMGIYVFNRDVLEEMLEQDEMIDFGKDVIPSSLKRYRVRAYPFDGYWQDIGTIKSFYEANIDLTTEKPSFDFFSPERPIFTHPRLLPPSKTLNCTVKDSLIAEGSVITASSIENSIIGIRSIIREGTKIERSILMGNDYYDKERLSPRRRTGLGIGKNCLIRNAIIDKNAHIGNNVKIINKKKHIDFDGKGYYVRDGIVIVEKNALISSGTII